MTPYSISSLSLYILQLATLKTNIYSPLFNSRVSYTLINPIRRRASGRVVITTTDSKFKRLLQVSKRIRRWRHLHLTFQQLHNGAHLGPRPRRVLNTPQCHLCRPLNLIIISGLHPALPQQLLRPPINHNLLVRPPRHPLLVGPVELPNMISSSSPLSRKETSRSCTRHTCVTRRTSTPRVPRTLACP